ncbi:alpha/beta hydrolase [Novosphingobium sp.]|uniref:alpha/beta hydrolase n=1 Tax=Novosphingobium sp. TaxID=1874826 RepID=UPI00286BF00C|nr:alpha/beta hydrolase [Novosphingobium sp.]
MRKQIILSCAALALLAGSLAEARPGGRLRDRIGGDQARDQVPQPPGKQTLPYGSDRLQNLDFWPAQSGNKRAPLVIFVHGGGWKRGSKDTASGSYKAPHYTGTGYAYAAINYRLVPEATVEDQAADVARSVRYLIDNAARLGFDPSRVVLMGHSAGAHLVALVGTDEQYLRGAGLSFSSINGVIPIDGAAYDVAKQMADGGNFMHDTYLQAFGSDPARQSALSPTLQAASPNAPSFLLIHVMRKDGVAQNKALETALRGAGTAVQRREFPGTGLKGHAAINRSLGDPAYAATPVVDAWLKRVFGV